MEKAILETLKFFDRYDYPLRAWEVHKWLIKKSASLRQVERSLNTLINKKKIEEKNGFYFLKGRKSIIYERVSWDSESERELSFLKIISYLLKLNPNLEGVAHDGQGIKNLSALINGQKDFDTALRALTAKIFWQRDNFYFKLLEKNDWVFKFFPNWVSSN